MRAYTHAYGHVYTHAYAHVYAHGNTRADKSWSTPINTHACRHDEYACLHTHLHARPRMRLCTCLHTCLHTSLCTCLRHVRPHAYTHTCVHMSTRMSKHEPVHMSEHMSRHVSILVPATALQTDIGPICPRPHAYNTACDTVCMGGASASIPRSEAHVLRVRVHRPRVRVRGAYRGESQKAQHPAKDRWRGQDRPAAFPAAAGCGGAVKAPAHGVQTCAYKAPE